jgi:hypothetical protein
MHMLDTGGRKCGEEGRPVQSDNENSTKAPFLVLLNSSGSENRYVLMFFFSGVC